MKIMFLSFGYEFSWDSIRALEIALYRTYCVPTISALLDRTGEFRERRRNWWRGKKGNAGYRLELEKLKSIIH